MFNVGQRAAVRNTFLLAGYVGRLNTLPLDSGDEVCFVLEDRDLVALQDQIALEQVLQQLLGRKVGILASVGNPTVPFD
jgi:hypothetical protein